MENGFEPAGHTGAGKPGGVYIRSAPEELLERVISNMHDAFFLLDTEWRFSYVNPPAERLLRRRVEDLLGKSLWDEFPDTVGSTIEERFRHAMEACVPVQFREYYAPLDLWADARLYPAHPGLAVLFFDATEQIESERLGRALLEITTLIHSTLDTDEVMRRAVSVASEGMGAESAAVLMLDGDEWVMRYSHNIPDYSGQSCHTEADCMLADRVRRTGKQVVVEDGAFIEGEPCDAVHCKLGGTVQPPMTAGIGLPLVARGEFIGMMSLQYHTKPWHFSHAQRLFGEELAASLALALSNSALFERQRRTAAINKALSTVNGLLLTTLDAEELMERVVEEATRALAADAGMVMSPAGDRFELAYPYGLSEEATGMTWSASELPGFSAVFSSGQPMVVSDAESDARVNSEFGRRFGLKSFIELPMKVEGETLGVLCFAYRQQRDLAGAHLDFALSLTDALSLALQNTRTYAREHRIANTLQQALLAMPQEIEAVEFAHSYRSASEAALVGGDFYDLFDIEDGSIGVTIGDVSGKGLGAAALTSLVKNTVRAYAEEGLSPEAVVARTNRRLVRETAVEVFVTLVVGRLDRNDGSFTYCNAGHPSLMLVSRSFPRVRALPANSPVAGAFADVEFTRSRVDLVEGDTLLMFTDGVVEVRNASEGLYGEDRVVKLAARNADKDPSALIDALCRDVVRFGGEKLSDDLAILAVRFSGPTGPSQVSFSWEE